GVGEAAGNAAVEAALGEHGEEALDGIEPGGGCRREVEDEARVTCQPFDDLRGLMGGIVVEDNMADLADRDLGLDLVEKADELLMPVLLHALPDHRTIAHVERGKEGGRSVPLQLG